MASPAPAKLASFISEYFRESTIPGTPVLKAASTASRVPPGVHELLFALVGISISMPGQMRDLRSHGAVHRALGFAVHII